MNAHQVLDFVPPFAIGDDVVFAKTNSVGRIVNIVKKNGVPRFAVLKLNSGGKIVAALREIRHHRPPSPLDEPMTVHAPHDDDGKTLVTRRVYTGRVFTAMALAFASGFALITVLQPWL